MPRPDNDHTGARIADYRKLRHLTQRGLAERAYLSRSSIAKVEGGFSAVSPALVSAVARVLEVPTAVLNGQPYTSEMQRDKLDRLISPLAEALDLYDLGPDPGITPRTSEQLVSDIEDLMRLARGAEYGRIGNCLPGLLGELTTAFYLAPDGTQRRRIAGALAEAYRTAHEFAYRLGYTDLGLVALERMGWAAEKADDPLMLAVRLYRRSLMALSRGTPNTAEAILERGQRLVGQADDPRSVPALAVSGELHLTGAVVAARARDADTAAGHLAAAKEHADRIGRDVPRVYWLSFGPTDVARRTVETRIELDQAGDALKAAAELRFPVGHSPMRVGRHHINMARLYARTGRHTQALRSLAKARRVTPQQVRYNPLARETIGTLVRRQRRAPEGLTSLARWVGM